jgi:hypothetical protein
MGVDTISFDANAARNTGPSFGSRFVENLGHAPILKGAASLLVGWGTGSAVDLFGDAASGLTAPVVVGAATALLVYAGTTLSRTYTRHSFRKMYGKELPSRTLALE